MNIPLNFCAKCGNPRNPGERICRFCGEPFPENKPNPDFFDDNPVNDADENTDVADTSHTDQDDSASVQDTSNDNEAVDQNNEETTSYNIAETEKAEEPASASLTEEAETTKLDPSPSADSSSLDKKPESSYLKIPKKGLWVSIAVLLTIALAAGITLLILSNRNSPSKVVKQAFEALKKNDSEAFCEQFNLSNTTKPYVKDMAKKMMSFLGDGFKDIEILEETVEEQKAIVKVNLIFDDGKKEQMDFHLVKMDDEWKIEPLGDFGFGLDSIFELGKKFGFGPGGTLQDDIGDILNNLF